ncbi:MAG: histidine kinase N-terminal 7TM domain-containing protein [Chloroflexota bacterium]
MFAIAFHPTVIPFAFSLIISICLAIFAFRKEQTPIVKTFGWLMVALSVWTFCYGAELITPSLGGKIFWSSMKYFGSTTGPVLWFVLAIQLTRNEHWLTWPLKTVLILFCVCVTAVVLTNSWHGWYWADVWVEPGLPEAEVEHGFFFWIYAIGPYLMTLTSVVLLFNYYRHSPPMYRRQALLMALGGFLPLALRMLEDIFGIDVIPLVDNIPLTLLLSGLLFAIAIFQYNALEMVHIAQDLVVQNISAGLIVLDGQQQIINLNPAATALIGQPDSQIVGKPASDFFGSERVESGQTFTFKKEGEPVNIVVQSSAVHDHRGENVGESLLLVEIAQTEKPALGTLTDRQEEVARLVVEGLTNKEIALELTISERTAKYHIGQILAKLQLQNRYEIRDFYKAKVH